MIIYHQDFSIVQIVLSLRAGKSFSNYCQEEVRGRILNLA
jgi:hypothetical protein